MLTGRVVDAVNALDFVITVAAFVITEKALLMEIIDAFLIPNLLVCITELEPEKSEMAWSLVPGFATLNLNLLSSRSVDMDLHDCCKLEKRDAEKEMPVSFILYEVLPFNAYLATISGLASLHILVQS